MAKEFLGTPNPLIEGKGSGPGGYLDYHPFNWALNLGVGTGLG